MNFVMWLLCLCCVQFQICLGQWNFVQLRSAQHCPAPLRNFANFPSNLHYYPEENQNVYQNIEPLKRFYEDNDDEQLLETLNKRGYYIVGQQLAPISPEPSQEVIVPDVFDSLTQNHNLDSELFDLSKRQDELSLEKMPPNRFAMEESRSLLMGPEGISNINENYYGSEKEQVHEILVHSIKSGHGEDLPEMKIGSKSKPLSKKQSFATPKNYDPQESTPTTPTVLELESSTVE